MFVLRYFISSKELDKQATEILKKIKDQLVEEEFKILKNNLEFFTSICEEIKSSITTGKFED